AMNASGLGAVAEVLIHTGQHYDYNMSRIFFEELGIRSPDYHLEAGSGLHGQQTGLIMERVEEVLLREKPDVVLVFGDTNSTLGAAVATSKIHLPVVHVEAGLRSFNKQMPEEINRVLTDHVSAVLFCPCRAAVLNLQAEGFRNVLNNGRLTSLDVSIKDESAQAPGINNPVVINVGDIMYDLLLHASRIAETKPSILDHLGVDSREYYLLTIHRAENTDDHAKFGDIVEFVNNLASEKTVLFPCHPRTKTVLKNSARHFSDKVRIIEPAGYFDMLMLLKNCDLVMTDSGGIQKEAYWMGVPCITLRDETEWGETVASGWNVLRRDFIGRHNVHHGERNAYGDGKASERIVHILQHLYP
ncbi:MAG: UDP-N-acetyl glucosamine 2-epimerase, partial [Nitrospiraceae bacterium]